MNSISKILLCFGYRIKWHYNIINKEFNDIFQQIKSEKKILDDGACVFVPQYIKADIKYYKMYIRSILDYCNHCHDKYYISNEQYYNLLSKYKEIFKFLVDYNIQINKLGKD